MNTLIYADEIGAARARSSASAAGGEAKRADAERAREAGERARARANARAASSLTSEGAVQNGRSHVHLDGSGVRALTMRPSWGAPFAAFGRGARLARKRRPRRGIVVRDSSRGDLRRAPRRAPASGGAMPARARSRRRRRRRSQRGSWRASGTESACLDHDARLRALP